MGVNGCGSVCPVTLVISISSFRVLSFLVFILRTLNLFNLFKSDNISDYPETAIRDL